jgi:hypothetical protein
MEKRVNKLIYIFIALMLLAAVGAGVYAATTGNVASIDPGHNSAQIFIPLGSSYATLQNAIDPFVGASQWELPAVQIWLVMEAEIV